MKLGETQLWESPTPWVFPHKQGAAGRRPSFPARGLSVFSPKQEVGLEEAESAVL